MYCGAPTRLKDRSFRRSLKILNNYERVLVINSINSSWIPVIDEELGFLETTTCPSPDETDYGKTFAGCAADNELCEPPLFL
jgi:hypothetical protein